MELEVTLDTCNKAGSRRSKSIPNLRRLDETRDDSRDSTGFFLMFFFDTPSCVELRDRKKWVENKFFILCFTG